MCFPLPVYKNVMYAEMNFRVDISALPGEP